MSPLMITLPFHTPSGLRFGVPVWEPCKRLSVLGNHDGIAGAGDLIDSAKHLALNSEALMMRNIRQALIYDRVMTMVI